MSYNKRLGKTPRFRIPQSGRSTRLDATASLYQCINMRTTLTLDDDIYRTVEAMAKGSGKRLGEVVSELLRQRLHAPPPVQMPEGDDGFDFITFPNTGNIIRSEDVRRAIEEEGVL